jgi:hypothetical protein
MKSLINIFENCTLSCSAGIACASLKVRSKNVMQHEQKYFDTMKMKKKPSQPFE